MMSWKGRGRITGGGKGGEGGEYSEEDGGFGKHDER